MRWSNRYRALLLTSGFFIATAGFAQSQVDEIGSLPTTLSPEQLQLASQLGSLVVPGPSLQPMRRQLPKPVLSLTPEEISYREAVGKLGVDKHRFVHCELPNGKVRTGVITESRDDGFTLKDGIIVSQWIPLQTSRPHPGPYR